MKRNTILSVLFSVLFIFPIASHGKCGPPETVISNAKLKFLEVEKIKLNKNTTSVLLSYSGLFKKENARQEGRRLISLLKKCYDTKYKTRKSLFSYSIEVNVKE
ncbi:hypothetical protein [Thalassotalea sp. ND16A]|uniref:hypothetical protein n=1 Tax=Thalassotalea sp. ND16A TaxID=1535422 RepID=UPI00051A005E|nr:hypothetical protein [Thalassotalea sp. ND16A]KGJ90511.1 hypothetical protein ND16A_1907 [Thalassotalea sp. ND16A]